MPNWKKVIVSGSNAVLNNITASGAISASGQLYAGLSDGSGISNDALVVLNPSTGELMYTSSFSEAGSITVTDTQGLPNLTGVTKLLFSGSAIVQSQDGGSTALINPNTLQEVTEAGNETKLSSFFLNNQNYSYGFATSPIDATSGFDGNVNGSAYTHVTPQITKFLYYPVAVQRTGVQSGYPDNYLVIDPGFYVIPSGSHGPDGPDINDGDGSTDHPNGDGTLGILTVDGGHIQVKSTGSTDSTRGILFTAAPNIYFFENTRTSVSGALIPASASAKIKFDTGSKAVKFFAGSTDEELKEVLHISKSGDNPRIGVGTDNPLTTFDFKDITDSRDGTKLILRSSRPTKGGNTGDEAGKINFTIDSSSYGDIQTSGSIAKILGSVTSISEQGASGKLSFEVADDNDVKQDTTEVFRLQKNPGGSVDLTYTVGVFQGSVNLNGSNSSLYAGKDVEAGGNITTTTGYVKADSLRIGTTQDPGGDSAIIAGDLILNNDFTSSGDISSSGDIIANNGSFSGDLTVDGNITANQYIVSSSVTYLTQSFSSGSTIFGDTLDDTHQFTGSVDITGSLTVDGMTYPTTDGNDGQVLLTDGSGVLSFGDVKVYAQVKNISGVTLAKGTPVHATASASPPSGNVSEVIAASASLASSMPATFILDEELAHEAEGRAILSGFINGVDTSAFKEGDVVYVGENGGYTTTKPTGTNLIQNLGIITKVDASNGAGYIYGSGRSNDVPNIAEGYAWVGNSSGVATATATSSFIAAGTISSSAQIATDISGAFTSTSASIASDIATNTSNISSIASFTASLDPDITTLSLPASTTISTFGANLIDDTNNIAARSTLGLGTIATYDNSDYVSIGGDILEGDLDFDSLDNHNIINVGEVRANTISGSTFVSDGVTVVSTPDAQTVKIGQSAGGSGPMKVSIVSSNTQYGLFSSTGIQLTGSVDISSTLSIPGFANVSASLAAAGTVDTTGTPANNQIARFTDSNTLKGDNDFTFDGTDMVIDALNSIIVNTNDNDAYFQIRGSSDNNLLQVNRQLDDKVGIGTSTPSEKLTVAGNISASGDITSNTFETISTTLASDSATNVDTFASSSYNGAIYDYILKDTGVGARAGQFMVAHDSGLITFTDNSTKHLSDATAPEISAQINGANIEVQVTNGNGYTFKSFVKKL